MSLGKSGARFIAETLKGYDVTHVFLVMAILRKTLVELEDVGIRRIVTHSEKAAAYMADGYARISRKPVQRGHPVILLSSKKLEIFKTCKISRL